MFQTSFFVLRGALKYFALSRTTMFYKGDFLLHSTTTRGKHVLSLKYIHGKVYLIDTDL